MTSLSDFSKHMANCNAWTILSDKTYAMASDIEDGEDPSLRFEMLCSQACERLHVPEQQYTEWIASTYDRRRQDPEAFMMVLHEADKPTIKLATISARDLQEKDIPPAVYIVEQLLTAGLAMIAAKPKMGKSWLVLDLCLAVSTGRPFLGYQTNQGECLYLALEDTERRLKSRMNKLLQGQRAPEGFYFTTSAHDIENGLIEELEAHVKEHPNTTLIVIDTLQRVRPPVIGREGTYAADYRAMTPLKAFADKHALCVLLVHHLRKMCDDGDPFNRISGTNGIMGALDTSIVIDRQERTAEDTTFSVTGRDIESQEKIIRFDKETCHWEMQGNADWMAEQRERQEYLNNPIAKTIKKLLDDSPDGQWSGSMSDLMSAGRYIARANLALNSRKLTSEVKKLEPLLLDYDGITHSRANNGNGGGKHFFSYCNSNVPIVPNVHLAPETPLSTPAMVCAKENAAYSATNTIDGKAVL